MNYVDVVFSAWKQVLGIDEVSLNKSFLDVGGTSISAERVAVRIKEATGIEITGADILRHRTIEAMSVVLKQKRM